MYQGWLTKWIPPNLAGKLSCYKQKKENAENVDITSNYNPVNDAQIARHVIRINDTQTANHVNRIEKRSSWETHHTQGYTWGKAEPPASPLCSKHGTPEHILICCSKALGEGRHCWWHAAVLKVIAETDHHLHESWGAARTPLEEHLQ